MSHNDEIRRTLRRFREHRLGFCVTELLRMRRSLPEPRSDKPRETVVAAYGKRLAEGTIPLPRMMAKRGSGRNTRRDFDRIRRPARLEPCGAHDLNRSQRTNLFPVMRMTAIHERAGHCNPGTIRR